jgi:hypothetical protein
MLGFEQHFGGGSDNGFVLPINSFGVRSTRALNRPATLASGRNPIVPFAGNLAVGGNIVIPVDSAALAYWLIAMFGLPTTTGSSPYVHEFKIPSSQPSLVLENAYTDLATAKYNRFVGCKITSFAITVGGDGELVATLGVTGRSDSMESSAFDASPTTITLARLNNFHAALLEGGATLANATEVSIMIGLPLTPYYVIGGGGLAGSLAEEKVEVSGNIKTLFEDTSLIDYAIAGTERTLKLTITGSSASVFELEIQELLYERNSPDNPGPQGMIADLNFQGYYENGSEASGIVARLTNATADYSSGVVPSVSLSPSSSASPSRSPSASISPSSSASPSS